MDKGRGTYQAPEPKDNSLVAGVKFTAARMHRTLLDGPEPGHDGIHLGPLRPR